MHETEQRMTYLPPAGDPIDGEPPPSPNNPHAFIASVLNQLEQPPGTAERSLIAQLHQFLSAVADGPIDSGSGMGASDFWCKYDGREFYIHIREK